MADDQLDQILSGLGRERSSRGQSPYDYDSDLDQSYWKLDFGFIPTARLGHFLGMRGLPATVLDIATDWPTMIGPNLVSGLTKNVIKEGLVKGAAVAAKDLGVAVKSLPVVAMMRGRDYASAFKEFLKSGSAGKTLLFPEEIDDLMMKATRSVKGAGQVEGELPLYAIHEATVADKQWNNFVAEQLERKFRTMPSERKAMLTEMANDEGKFFSPPSERALADMKRASKEADLIKRKHFNLQKGRWDSAEAKQAYQDAQAEAIAAKKVIQEPAGDLAAARARRAQIQADYKKAKEAGDTERAQELLKDLRVARRELPKMYQLTPEDVRPEWAGKIAEDDIAILNSWRVHQADMADYLASEGLIKGWIDEYVPRVMKFKNPEDAIKAGSMLAKKYGGSAETLSAFSTAFMKRTIPLWDDFKEIAQKLGATVETDFGKLVTDTYRSVGKAAADKRALRVLAQYQATDDALGEKIPMLVSSRDDIPRGYERFYEFTDKDPIVHAVAREQDILAKRGNTKQLYARVHQAWDKATEAAVTGNPAKLMAVKEDEREKVLQALSEAMAFSTEKAGAYVYKPSLKELRRMYGYGLARTTETATGTEKTIKATLWLNSIAKRLSLSLSAFHFVALTESAVAELGWDFIRHPVKALQFAKAEIHKASDLVELAVRSGLQLGPTLDTEKSLVREGLDRASKWLDNRGLLGKMGLGVLAPLKGFEILAGKVDLALWDYYHNGLKTFAFSEIFHDALRRPQFAEIGSKEIARSVAQHVNMAFGGLNWQRFFFSKKGQDALRLLLFAPDWTLSNILTSADVWTNAMRVGAGEKFPMAYLLADDVRAFYARQFALRSRIYMAMFGNMANYAFSAWRTGQGHWMDGNQPGADIMIEMPWADEKGKPQYYRFGKHFTDATDMLRAWDAQGGPLQFFKRKAATIPRIFTTLAFGQDMAGHPIVGVDDGPVKEMVVKFGYAAEHFEPFFVRAIREFITDRVNPPKRRAQVPVQSSILTAIGLPTYKAPREPKKKNFLWSRDDREKIVDQFLERYKVK